MFYIGGVKKLSMLNAWKIGGLDERLDNPLDVLG